MKYLLLSACLLGSACIVHAGDSNYLRSPMPDTWSYTEAAAQQLPSDDAWWQGFGDPTLDSLVNMAENANFDIDIAARRMESSRRQMQIARSSYYPQIGLTGGYERSRSQGVTENIYTARATASWEIDLFGKITAGVRQAKSQYRASRAEWVGAMVSVAAEIAADYMQLRVWQAELAVAEAHIERQDTIAGIANTRFECGLVSKIDVEQANSILYSTRATVPALRSSIHSTINAIALLVGEYPQNIAAMLSRPAPMPDYRRIIASGVPAELLRRRPDIVAAEYNLAAQAAAVGIAKKDFLPTLTIEGSVGLQSNGHGKFFSSDNLAYSVGPTLSWTVFDGMARSARVAQAREEMESLVDTYNYTVMNAYCEVDNALAAYTNAVRQIAEYERAADASEQFLDRSLDLYRQGLSDFTNVANAQVDYLTYTNSLITARGNALSALVSLYEALGGGFETNMQ